MRIVMLAPFGIRPKGTLLARMLPLAQALHQRGHAVSLVAPAVHNPEDAGSRVVHGGIPVIHAPVTALPGPLATLAQSAVLLRLALAECPDLLHLFKPKGYGGLAVLASRLPLVVDMDDWEGFGGWNDLLPYPTSAKQLFAWQERDLPRRAAALTVASRTLESLVWGMGVPPERVFYLPNGVATAPEPSAGQPTANPTPTMLLYTRFWELDLPELITALVAIYQAKPAARLLVVGRGEQGEEQQLLALAERAGVRAMITYQGWLEPASIPGVIAQATLALVPARDTLINRARCSAKLLELLAAGLPVIASDVGEARHMVLPDQAGLIVPPANPAALARAAIQLLNTPAHLAHYAAGARAAAARYQWEHLAPAAEAAYRQALHQASPSPKPSDPITMQ
ncbi:MAG: glycosyltransferase family 4 protein [Oscillochloridaceae bacterium umkhey_bin13]